MDQFDIGDNVVLTLEFTVAGVATDPTTQTCTVLDPADGETVVALTRTGTGTFTGVFSPTMSGVHWCRGVGTGTAKCAFEMMFVVRKRRVT